MALLETCICRSARDGNAGIAPITLSPRPLATSSEVLIRRARTSHQEIRNTGTISLYNFSFEIRHNDTNITQWNATAATAINKANPLRPSESCIIAADVTEDLNGTLNEVTILNDICPSKSITNDNF